MKLTWERHTEFISLTWECDYENGAQAKLWALSKKHAANMMSIEHLMIAATRCNLLIPTNNNETPEIEEYDPSSLCMSLVKNERALILTDFYQDEFGAIKFTVVNLKNLDARNCGILVRRLLELETYRVMSLFGYEQVRGLFPHISAIEKNFLSTMNTVKEKSETGLMRKTLDEIMDIATDHATLAAGSQYRFAATRAYYNNVCERLARINETGVPSYSKIEEFLNKRLAPAMRTVENVERRILVAGEQLDRSTALVRTKVDMKMQEQNKKVLENMNKRALRQYQLQKTVEGLSVAAVSYYIVGLLNYMSKGFHVDRYIDLKLLTAIFVPIVVLGVWAIDHRVRSNSD